MVFRDLFSETPYAASLNEKNLRVRCSTCFVQNTTTPCEQGCGKVFYCSEKCRNEDRSFHEFECAFYKKSETAKVDRFARLLARIMARKRIDGGVVNLCNNFPKNVPDRRLSDLISHQSEIEKCKYRSKEMRHTLKEYRQAFESTPLVDDWAAVRRMYCIMWINCFSVSGALSITKGHESSIGYGFYLNTSRFNHACHPELFVDFDGSRLIVQYPSQQNDQHLIEKERSSFTKSAEKFNSLTISYGYSNCFTNDCVFPLREQRRASLAFAYYFECHCVLCDDEREAALEENAASIECQRCNQPYLWNVPQAKKSIWCWTPSSERALLCRKSCRCRFKKNETDAVKIFVKSLKAKTTYLDLEEEWKKVMASSIKCKYANEIIKECEPFVLKARKFWHPAANLRLAQLNERLFVSYGVTVMSACEDQSAIDLDILQMGLETGEALFLWLEKHPMNTYETAVAAYAYELAQLYQVSAMIAANNEFVKHFKRAAFWYTYAASIWKIHGNSALDYADELTKMADEMKRMSEEIKLTKVADGTKQVSEEKNENMNEQQVKVKVE